MFRKQKHITKGWYSQKGTPPLTLDFLRIEVRLGLLHIHVKGWIN